MCRYDSYTNSDADDAAPAGDCSSAALPAIVLLLFLSLGMAEEEEEEYRVNSGEASGRMSISRHNNGHTIAMRVTINTHILSKICK